MDTDAPPAAGVCLLVRRRRATHRPRCDRDMTTTTPATTPHAPQLIADVPCLRCRYNLRGLDPPGQCPECGHLVHVSVLAWDEDRRRVPSILESDPRWIRALAEGLFIAAVVF